MSDLEPKEASQLGDHPAYGEAPSRIEARSRNYDRESALWFIVPCSLLMGIFSKWLPWLPWYQAVGISFFVAGLVGFRHRGPRLRQYGFGRYLIYYLFVSAGFSLLAFAIEALVSALFSR